MYSNEPVTLKRDCDAAMVPVGTRVTLKQGEQAYITQSLGGSYTVIVNGNMFRIDGKNADALGLEQTLSPAAQAEKPASLEDLEKLLWQQMKTCYDPEIPVNVVDLGLIYDCAVEPVAGGGNRVDVKMTLTAPGCGMGEHLRHDVQSKLLEIEGVDEVNVALVWEPPWNQSMMTEAAKLQLGLL
jgi:probable FeS assembly SUF system protein SufT